jgi:very-short-patch-repair endonuclease
LHGTPRVTVLVGGDGARALWTTWLAQTGATDAGIAAPRSGLAAIAPAVASAIAEPTTPIAIVLTGAELARYRAAGPARSDREHALVEEGVLVVDDTGLDDTTLTVDARSAAEAALLVALEATAETAGRFELNAKLAVRFGPAACEVDLLARKERVAVEIDGYHHFTDATAYRRDREKDLLLQSQHLLVVRVLAADVARDPRPAIDLVRRALAIAEART